MYNFSVVLDGKTFTQADFEGLNYLAGLPNSIEALVDEALGDVNTPWPTSNDSFNPTALPVVTFSISAPPRREIPVGAYVVVVKAGLDGMCGIVTSATSSTLTIKGLAPLSNASNGTTPGPWTIARVRNALTPYPLKTTGTPAGGGGGYYGSESTDQSVLFQGPASTRIIENSSNFPLSRNLYPTLDGGVICKSNNDISIGNDEDVILTYAPLAPFLYGTCWFDLYYTFTEAEAAFQSYLEFKSLSGDFFIRVFRDRIQVSLPGGVNRTVFKSSTKSARFIYTAHRSRLQVLEGTSSLFSTTITDKSMLMWPTLKFVDPARFYGTPYLTPPTAYYRFSYIQQVWR